MEKCAESSNFVHDEEILLMILVGIQNRGSIGSSWYDKEISPFCCMRDKAAKPKSV